MTQLFFNNARGVLAESVSTGSTLIKIKDHANIPTSLAIGDYFLLTLFRDTTRYGENIEVVKVTAITAGTNDQLNLTVERGYEFPAQIHTAGARLEARLTAQSLRDLLSEAKSFTQAEVAALLDAAPGALDTLNELAAALGDDPNFAATMTTELGKKLDKTSYTAADVLAKLLTVDGANSGLDADKLDGKQLATIEQEYTAADQAHVDALNPHPQYTLVEDDSATIDWNFATGKYARDNGERVETTNLGDLATITRPDTKQMFGPNGFQRTAIAGAVARQWNPVTGEAEGAVQEKASKNLVKFSETFVVDDWIKTFNPVVSSGVIEAPSGKLAGTSIGDNNTDRSALIDYKASGVGERGKVYTASIYIKRGTSTSITLNAYAVDGSQTENNLVVDTYSMTVISASGPNMKGYGVAEVCNGWHRVWLSFSCNLNGSMLRHRLWPTDRYVGGETGNVYIWGAQLELGDKPTSYIPTPATFESRASTGTYFDSNGVLQTAAIDEPRENHVLVDGQWASQGLLIEPKAATNKLLWSEAFDNAVWVKAGATVTADTATAPDGTVTAYKLVQDTSSGYHEIKQEGISVIQGAVYSVSTFVKAAEYTLFSFKVYHGAADEESAHFDLSSGAVSSDNSKLGLASVTDVGGGWFYCSFVVENNSDTTSTVLFQMGNGDTYTGDGTSGLYLWGAQFEEGTQPSSYIKTTDTPVTRAADVVSSVEVERAQDDLTAPLTGEYNPRQGTWVIDAEHNDVAPLTGIGLDGAYTSGKGKLVYSYDENGGEAFANGAKVFDTPPVKKAQTVGLGHQTTGRVQYFPKKLPVAQAIARATGSVAVDYPFADGRSFYTDFNANDYGVQNYQNAVETLRTNDPGEVLTVARNSPTWVLESDGVYRQVASNVLAREWNPETQQYQAQISGSVTNELLWSTDFSNAAWGSTVSVSASSVPSPFNGNVFYEVTDDGDSLAEYLGRGVTVSDDTITRTASAIVSAGTSNVVRLTIAYTGGTIKEEGVWVDLTTGEFLTNGNALAKVDEISSGVFRISCSVKNNGLGNNLARWTLRPASRATLTSKEDETLTGSVLLAHAQLVEGNVPGPVIVTEGAPVTRDADKPTRTLGAEFNKDGGTFYGEVDIVTVAPNSGFAAIIEVFNNADLNQRFSLFVPSVANNAVVVRAQNANVTINNQVPKPVGVFKYAAYYKTLADGQLEIAVSVDGAEPVTALGVMPNGLNEFRLGFNRGGAGHGIQIHSHTTYIPRALTLTELQALTAL
ncbi:phage head spike fiber domain-containing protein [Vreelandella aquamarina]|uniref:Uncharacterized protein n=1 Tax=Vreelandella aquamarina TaxID=77097 RepID=A0A6F8SVC4_9GAMM|nr:hypothetical protein [Halomonas meridiana]BCA91887.1 hypothetical protein HMSLTHF_16620 [Halomonas meridiana]